MEAVFMDLAGAAAVLVLLGTFFFGRRIQYMFHAAFILAFSIMQTLFMVGLMPHDVGRLIVVKYMLTLVVVMAGRELIRSGIEEKQENLKKMSIGLGVTIILLVIIPSLNDVGAMSVTIPSLPWFINNALYIIGGILLLIGSVFIND